jgi:hypothetical protein
MSDSTNTTGEVPATVLDPAVAALTHEYPQAPTELLRELAAYRNALPLALGPSSCNEALAAAHATPGRHACRRPRAAPDPGPRRPGPPRRGAQ